MICKTLRSEDGNVQETICIHEQQPLRLNGEPEIVKY